MPSLTGHAHTYTLPRSCKEPASDLVKSTKEPVAKMANNAHAHAAVPFLVLALNTSCRTGLDPLVVLHHLCCSSLGATANIRLKTLTKMRAFHIFRGFQVSFPAAESLSCQSHAAGLGASSRTQHVSAKAAGSSGELAVNIRSPCTARPLPCAITGSPGRPLAKADAAFRCG